MINTSSGITLVKFGGALFTDKTKAQTVRPKVLARLVSEIAAIWPIYQGRLIIGHGQGSFAHFPAQKYQTTAGFKLGDKERHYGAAIVHNLVAQLNQLVIDAFLKGQVPVMRWVASSVYSAKNTLFEAGTIPALLAMLKAGFLPVTGGDVLMDSKQQVCIWSTEQVFEQLIADLVQNGQAVSQVIYVTEVAGLLDAQQKVVPQVTLENWKSLQSNLGKTKGVDVTGGMKLKMEHCLRLAQQGIKTKILSGTVPGNMTKALLDQDWIGTEVVASL